jgi:hypothetical protein
MGIPSASVPVEIGITDESHAACSIIVVGIAPMSTPVEVVTSGNVQDAATCGKSSSSHNLSEESLTLVGKLATLAPPSLSEVSETLAGLASLDLSEESKTLVGKSVTLASPMAASSGSPIGIAD